MSSLLSSTSPSRSSEAEAIEDAIDDVDPEELEGMDVSMGSWKVAATAPTAAVEGENVEVILGITRVGKYVRFPLLSLGIPSLMIGVYIRFRVEVYRNQ